MQGTVYKELVQNRFFLLCGLFLPPLVYAVAVLMGLIMKAGAGRRVVRKDYVSGLFAAEPVIIRPHIFQNIAVANCGYLAR